MTPKGFVPIGELRRGDQVLGMVDGKETFTTLTSWFDKEEEKEMEFLKLRVEGGEFEVSAKHNIYGSDGTYYLAEEASELFGVGAVK